MQEGAPGRPVLVGQQDPLREHLELAGWHWLALPLQVDVALELTDRVGSGGNGRVAWQLVEAKRATDPEAIQAGRNEADGGVERLGVILVEDGLTILRHFPAPVGNDRHVLEPAQRAVGVPSSFNSDEVLRKDAPVVLEASKEGSFN